MSWKEIYADWNPWHGCTKISAGCKYCYVYRQDEMFGSEKSSSTVTLNADFGKPIKHKSIIVAPILERVELIPFLDNSIEEVSVSGESGLEARVCDYSWILDLRGQCIEADVPFRFHQTGAKLFKDGKLYRIRRQFQIAQVNKACINYRIGKDHKPVSHIK